MDAKAAAARPMYLQNQPKYLRVGLGSGELTNLFFSSAPHGGQQSFPRRFKNFCLRKEGTHISPWEEKPYEIFEGGIKLYLDEQDIATFVDPSKVLIPLDTESYNPAAYLWKKIADVPEERRHHLLSIIKPRNIPRLWKLAGTRFQDAKLVKKKSSMLLSMDGNSMSPEYWRCRTSKGLLPFSWLNDFGKAIFHGKDGGTYGRIRLSALIPAIVSKNFGPLYFTVRQVSDIMATEQPCDFAYEFGNGLLSLDEFPEGFPIPAKHTWPFNDHLVIYIRHVGPGVVVGQAWQEGNDIEQVPKKFCVCEEE
ncbi:hypothetical protein HPP92_016841 [Vanilla planifolia]|uniref:Uncharacterized protein n=1 Tax=Vanilla planifolia TaxID=51239 RepID=A0A835QFJ5_VANPL|nr:hypothetical protein HPP92_016841 [Vanilla planifolia]